MAAYGAMVAPMVPSVQAAAEIVVESHTPVGVEAAPPGHGHGHRAAPPQAPQPPPPYHHHQFLPSHHHHHHHHRITHTHFRWQAGVVLFFPFLPPPNLNFNLNLNLT